MHMHATWSRASEMWIPSMMLGKNIGTAKGKLSTFGKNVVFCIHYT